MTNKNDELLDVPMKVSSMKIKKYIYNPITKNKYLVRENTTKKHKIIKGLWNNATN